MSGVGLEKNFVDTQGVSLINSSDSKIYTQLKKVSFDIKRVVNKRQLTNDNIDNTYSLYLNGIEGELVLTTLEWADLVSLTAMTAGVLPVKLWQVKWTNSAKTIKTTSFNGEMSMLRPVDQGLGDVTLFFRIEADEAVAVT